MFGRLSGLALAIAAIAAASEVRADVVKAEPGGFEIVTSTTIAAPPAAGWNVLLVPTRWWDPAHTYSGDAANLSIDPRVGGCFCEMLSPAAPRAERGGVEHARIVYIQPSKVLRLRGALGPLQAEAVAGTLTFTLSPVDGSATKVTLSYVVGGYVRGGAGPLAPAVDGVLAQQMARLRRAATVAR